jgi:hypothetical protein
MMVRECVSVKGLKLVRVCTLKLTVSVGAGMIHRILRWARAGNNPGGLLVESSGLEASQSFRSNIATSNFEANVSSRGCMGGSILEESSRSRRLDEWRRLQTQTKRIS